MASISTFTSGGKAVSGVGRASVRPAALGHFDPSTGRVYQRPRARLNDIQGRSVRVTNPRALPSVLAQRTASIGANAAGQRKRFDSP